MCCTINISYHQSLLRTGPLARPLLQLFLFKVAAHLPRAQFLMFTKTQILATLKPFCIYSSSHQAEAMGCSQRWEKCHFFCKDYKSTLVPLNHSFFLRNLCREKENKPHLPLPAQTPTFMWMDAGGHTCEAQANLNPSLSARMTWLLL